MASFSCGTIFWRWRGDHRLDTVMTSIKIEANRSWCLVSWFLPVWKFFLCGHCETLKCITGSDLQVSYFLSLHRCHLSFLWLLAVGSESFECVKLLMRKGAVVNINHQIYTGYTPLHTAAEKGFTHILDYLLKHGARLDICADVDMTPIFLASQFGYKDCLQILLQTAREKGKELNG